MDVSKDGVRARKVMDLLTGLRMERSVRLFIVLGDPGSGKSVSLRKLRRELLDETFESRRIPVYINLKEWFIDKPWSQTNKPTEEQFKDFVISNASQEMSLVSKATLIEHFDSLLAAGHFFFIMDSFDEMPGILDANERSWLVKELSGVVTRFMLGGDEARGVIASRYFRQPEILHADRCLLEIRPFTEAKIAHALEQSVANADEILKAIFQERGDLAAVARNPFSLSLIVQYINDHPRQLPKSQAELYHVYIEQSLKLAKEALQTRGMRAAEVLDDATDIAWRMFDSATFGLEIPIDELLDLLPGRPVRDLLDVLIDARIGRLSQRRKAFSFVHRRFNEYFLVRMLLKEGPEAAPIEAIPEDSRWRDALVLYADVAPADVASEIAKYCWEEAKKIFGAKCNPELDEAYYRALHALRFLTEAFRGRRDVLLPIEKEIAALSKAILQESDDLLVKKNCVEVAGLLSSPTSQALLLSALGSGNRWLIETAIRSCRYVGHISKEVQRSLIMHVSRLGISAAIFGADELSLSLRLAESFKKVRMWFNLRRLDAALQLVGIVVFCACFPVGGLAASAATVFSETAAERESGREISKLVDGLPFALFMVVSISWMVALAWEAFLPGPARNGESLAFFFGLFWIVLGASIGLLKLGGIDAWSAVWMIALTCVVLWLPKVYLMLLGWQTVRMGRWRRIVMWLAMWVGGMAAMFGFFWAVAQMWNWLDIKSEWPKRLLLAFAGFALMFQVYMVARPFISGAFQRKRDKQRLRTHTRILLPDRVAIEDHFRSFETQAYRLRYAEWLWREARGRREEFQRVGNHWRNNRRPNLNDEASRLLAELDALWMGVRA